MSKKTKRNVPIKNVVQLKDVLQKKMDDLIEAQEFENAAVVREFRRLIEKEWIEVQLNETMRRTVERFLDIVTKRWAA